MMTKLVIAILALCAVALLVEAGDPCPKLTAANVDEKFLFDNQPPGGFYSAMSWGMDSMPKYTEKAMTASKGSNKLCYKATMGVGGLSVPAPGIECHFEKPSSFFCESKGGAGAAAMSAAGLKISKQSSFTIVDTDNKSYLAMGGCIDGAYFMWMILTTEQGNKKVKGSTIKALGLTGADAKAMQSKKIKVSRVELSKGGCSGKGAGALGGLSGGGGIGGLLG